MAEAAYVFAFIGSKGCGACLHFRQNFWVVTKKDLEKIPGIKVVEYETPTLGSPLPTTLPKGLGHYVQWYPTFILVRKDDWDKGNITQAAVFNGQEISGKWVPAKTPEKIRPRESASIIAWVKEIIESGSLNTKGPIFSSLHQGKNQVRVNIPKTSKDKIQGVDKIRYCEMGYRPLLR